jgi:hypothetical protein
LGPGEDATVSHGDYHYSVTVETQDPAVLHCLRALSQFAQRTGNKRIPWGGTKEADWRATGHCVTFHFSAAIYRTRFCEEIARLLPAGSCSVVSQNDAHPATPQHSAW